MQYICTYICSRCVYVPMHVYTTICVCYYIGTSMICMDMFIQTNVGTRSRLLVFVFIFIQVSPEIPLLINEINRSYV